MALAQIELPELQTILSTAAELARREHPLAGEIFYQLYATGLRIAEVLETTRWEPQENGSFIVKLSKREGSRLIPAQDIRPMLAPYFTEHRPFEMQTYSSVNNSFKRNSPPLYFETFTKTTALHAYRYAFIKQLRANGLSINEIAVVMGHLGTAATSEYVIASIWRGPYK